MNVRWIWAQKAAGKCFELRKVHFLGRVWAKMLDNKMQNIGPNVEIQEDYHFCGPKAELAQNTTQIQRNHTFVARSDQEVTNRAKKALRAS